MRTTLVVAALLLIAPSPARAELATRRVLLGGPEARGPAKRVGKAAASRIAEALSGDFEAVPVAGKALRKCQGRAACLKAAARRAHSDLVLASSVRKQGKRFLLEFRLFSGSTGELAGRSSLVEKPGALPGKAAAAAKRLLVEHAPAPLKARAAASTVAPDEGAPKVSAAQNADREDPR